MLSYGHSNSLLEDQKEFIRALESGESKFTKIDLTDQTISVSGDVALVRPQALRRSHNKGEDPAQDKTRRTDGFPESQRKLGVTGQAGILNCKTSPIRTKRSVMTSRTFFVA